MSGMKTIMIIEDFEGTSQLIRRIVELGGYKTSLYENGSDAYNDLNQSIDLILCDINMPVMDGFEFLKKLRSSNEFKHIPLIFITAEDEVKEEARKYGANGFISKPFSKEKILAVIKKVL